VLRWDTLSDHRSAFQAPEAPAFDAGILDGVVPAIGGLGIGEEHELNGDPELELVPSKH
jgi:hypothetical protein